MHNTVCHFSQIKVNNNNCFVFYSSLHWFAQTITNHLSIIQQIFITEIFKHSSSSHKTDWNFTNSLACFVLPFIWQGKQSDEYSWRRMFMTLPSRNRYKCKHHSLLLFVYFVYIYPCSVVGIFLFTCLPVFTLDCCCISVYLFTIFLCWYLFL